MNDVLLIGDGGRGAWRANCVGLGTVASWYRYCPSLGVVLRWFVPILLSVGMSVVILATFPVASVQQTQATAGPEEPPPPVGWRYTKKGWIFFERPLPQAAEPLPPAPFAFHPGLLALLQALLSVGALAATSSRLVTKQRSDHGLAGS